MIERLWQWVTARRRRLVDLHRDVVVERTLVERGVCEAAQELRRFRGEERRRGAGDRRRFRSGDRRQSG